MSKKEKATRRLISSIGALLPRRWRFEWRYWRRATPWDTGVTPPEVMEFIAQAPPGDALDLGCGTGTNAITLARLGWQVTGIDFAPRAIRSARIKAAKAGVHVRFYVADVTRLDWLTGAYDYVLDIGCLFTLREQDRIAYARELTRLIRPGGWYMLYAWLPRMWQGKTAGIGGEDVRLLLSGLPGNCRTIVGEEKGFPSAWYWFQRSE
jgi:2-polyprenyl-3-methyl-5-hydroxy-6-metoxy-1,4-benzoquinol methylase